MKLFGNKNLHMQIRFFFTSLVLISVLGVHIVAFQTTLPMAAPAQSANLVGRWRVTFTLSGIGEKHLVFESQAKGSGSFLLLDTEPENKAAAASLPAVWSQTTNDRLGFSGDVELPLGTCCREVGTLIFKGKFDSSDSITGKAIFVGSTIDEENFNGFRSTVGTFTATRVTDKS